MTQEQAPFDLESLLDGQLEDLPDLPSNEPWPTGAYKAKMAVTQKVVKNKPAFEVAFTLLQVLEIANPAPDVVAPKEGDKTSVLYFLDNEWGLGAFKKLMVQIAGALNLTGANIRTLTEACNDLEVGVMIEAKPDKNKVVRNNIKEVFVS